MTSDVNENKPREEIHQGIDGVNDQSPSIGITFRGINGKKQTLFFKLKCKKY